MIELLRTWAEPAGGTDDEGPSGITLRIERLTRPAEVCVGGRIIVSVDALLLSAARAPGTMPPPPLAELVQQSDVAPTTAVRGFGACRACIQERWVVLRLERGCAVLHGALYGDHLDRVWQFGIYEAPSVTSGAISRLSEASSYAAARAATLCDLLPGALLLAGEERWEDDMPEPHRSSGGWISIPARAVDAAIGDRLRDLVPDLQLIELCGLSPGALLGAAYAWESEEPIYTGDTADTQMLRLLFTAVISEHPVGWLALDLRHCEISARGLSDPLRGATNMLGQEQSYGQVAAWLCDPSPTIDETLLSRAPGKRIAITDAAPPTGKLSPSYLDTTWGREFFSDWLSA